MIFIFFTQELPYSTALKYTVAKYYTPSGRCIQSVDYKEGKNKQKFKAIKKIITLINPKFLIIPCSLSIEINELKIKYK